MREDVAAEAIDIPQDLEGEGAAVREIEQLVWGE